MITKESENIILTAWEQGNTLTPANCPSLLKQTLDAILAQLEQGSLRAASFNENTQQWQVYPIIKQAILLYFRTQANQLIDAGFTQFYDKVSLQFQCYTADDHKNKGVRLVPPAIVRRGAYIGPNTVLMPSYVNIGAYVGEGSMIDTWATVGSCAQIGAHVHISGGVGIGGVLEPLQASPTIIEDNCFIGARSEIVEGVIVERNSVISMGVYIGQSTKIYDREKDEVFYGRVPAGSVVVPGNLPAENGKYGLYCAVIVKKVDEKVRQKLAINEILRGL
jgi:2,3,4,5-tetrahydropyridine-2-carboxylate N-succinyltransferase